MYSIKGILNILQLRFRRKFRSGKMVTKELLFIAVILAILGLISAESSECQLKRAVAIAKSKQCKLFGVFIPQCEKNGSYSPLQCSGSSGICCCANPKTGVELPSTCFRAPAKPVCPAKELSKCQEQRAVALKQIHVLGLRGVFVPRCEKDGTYFPIQTPLANEYCCADPDTGVLSNCVIGPKRPNCCDVLSKCQKQRAAALKLVKLGLQGIFVPRCEKDGSYSTIQTPLANQFCCADPSTGTLSNCAIGKTPDCGNHEYSKCEVQRAVGLALNDCGMVGNFVPTCQKDGSYSPAQCGDGGYCCCVDPVTGKEQNSSCVRAPKMPKCAKTAVPGLLLKVKSAG